MIPKDCKRLAEVDFPIAEVSRHAVAENAIRDGHPKALHLWWARRPLASSRALLLGLLWPDPCDPRCPTHFKDQARTLLRQVGGCDPGSGDQDLRSALLKFIAQFANWDLASSRTYLEVSRALVRAAHGAEAPVVTDPFAGGGSIPLEALRLGCDAFASDLNPVACLILKVLLEDIPRIGPNLIEDIARVGAEINRHVEQTLADSYPADPDGSKPIAYLWARTVRCESPNCGAEIPLTRSFTLSKRRNLALRHLVARPAGQFPRVEFEIFQPKSNGDVPHGTVSRAKATCIACGVVLPPERVRAQLKAQRGGADVLFDTQGHRVGGARMLAVVALKDGERGRQYRLPTNRDYEPVRKAQTKVDEIQKDWERSGNRGLRPLPDEPTPAGGGSGAGRAFSAQRYGMFQWSDLFSARQKIALLLLATRIKDIDASGRGAVARSLALALGKTADLENAGAPWKPDRDCPVHLFSGQKVPPLWDWAEAVPFGDASGSFGSACERTTFAIRAALGFPYEPGVAAFGDATKSDQPDASASIWFTDPPYYDAIPYSDLSDFFFVWLKRALVDHQLLHDPFDPANPLTPKSPEAVQDESRTVDGRPKDKAFFEATMARAFAAGRRALQDDGIGAVVFAHKTTEGWEALLSGMIRAGWTITASWPIATELGSRLRARDSAALATSVHLICRPRPDNAHIGDWAAVLRELPSRVGDWMERLQGEGVRGADLVFACIGPALEVFSRYTKVETAEGREVKLDEYLQKVWEVVGRSALAQVLGTAEAKARNGAAGAVEEDARLTALFLWTLQATEVEVAEDSGDSEEDEEGIEDDEEEGTSGGNSKGFTLVFDVVRRFAQPLGIELPKWEGRVIETKKGVVRLLPIAERAKQLFGEDGAHAVASRLEEDASLGLRPQLSLFPEERQPELKLRARRRRSRSITSAHEESLNAPKEATTLDRVHAAMLLQASGRTNALRALLNAEQERGPDFLRLANALSALYPKASEEKRLLDAMLLAVPR